MRTLLPILVVSGALLVAAAPVASADFEVVAIDWNGDGRCDEHETVSAPIPVDRDAPCRRLNG